MIENEDQLRDAVREAGNLIQQISDYVRHNRRHQRLSRVRFPRGFIKTAYAIRQNLKFIDNAVLRQNVSYALMTHEVLRWVVFHTDLSGQAQEMLIKEAVCLLGNVCESITIFPTEHGLGRGSGFLRRVRRFQVMNIIDAEVVAELEWLWEKRNQEHLYDVPFREWSHYTEDDWVRAVRAYLSLRDGLNAWRGFPVEV